jgi:hypothetical protein
MSGRRVRPLRVTEAEVPELARRLRDAINAENALFESLGEEPLSGEELKQLTKDVARRLKRGERGEHAQSEVFSETDGVRRSSPARSKPPLRETAGEERRRTMAEAADGLLPDLPDASAPTQSLAKPPHELYRDDKAAWHQWKRQAADRLLPSDPVTGAPPDPRQGS